MSNHKKRKHSRFAVFLLAAVFMTAGCSFPWGADAPSAADRTEKTTEAGIPKEIVEEDSREESSADSGEDPEVPEECRSYFNGETVFFDAEDYFFHPELENLAYDKLAHRLYFNNIVIAYLSEDLNEAGRQQLAEAVGGRLAGNVSGPLNMIQVEVPPTDLQGLEKAAAVLLAQDAVYFADTDFPIEYTEDAEDQNPWGGEQDRGNTDDPGGNDWWAEAIDAYTAWDRAGDVERVTVGIIDSGFYPDHEDLRDHIQVTNDCDRKEHGTHVAGLIAASDNQVGIRGVSDGSPLICYGAEKNHKSVSSAQEQFAQVAVLVKNGAKIINISRGSYLKSFLTFSTKDMFQFVFVVDDYDEYVEEHYQTMLTCGKLCIAVMLGLYFSGYDDYIITQSAGNGYDNEYKNGFNSFYNGYFNAVNALTYNQYVESLEKGAELFAKLWPEADQAITAKRDALIEQVKALGYSYFTDRIIRVGAVGSERTSDGDYRMAAGSNYDVDICAPGTDVYSSIYVALNGNSNYGTMSGTSMAAPITAGAAALLWAMDPTLSPGELKMLLLDSAIVDAIDEDADNHEMARSKYPMLNVGAAANKLKTKEISPYISHPHDLLFDWQLAAAEGLPNLAFPRIAKESGFVYGESDQRIMNDGPGFLFVTDNTSNVTLYGVSMQDPIGKMQAALQENGWYNNSGSYTVEHVTDPKGKDLTVTEERFHMTGVDIYDMSLLVYYTPDGKMLYWIMTNEGMATMDNAVENYILGYVYPQ